MRKLIIGLILATGCATMPPLSPEQAYIRQHTAQLVVRLASYPPGWHEQRCEIIKSSFQECRRDGWPKEACGWDGFELGRQGEQGCGFIK